MTTDLELKTVFLGMFAPEASGASGLLESVMSVVAKLELEMSKLVGITTDGESANTGRTGGLWKLLSEKLGRELMTFWCCAHRSDLAIEQVIHTVPELKLWKTNLISVASYFRTSKNRLKKLHEIFPSAKQFPRYHEVRFAQHFCNLADAVLFNLEACMKVWESIAETGNRVEKSEARGYLATWKNNSFQKWMTSLMGDVLDIFRVMQQQMQRNDLILPDVLTCRDAAVRKLTLMEEKPFPGKREEKATENDDENYEEVCHRRVANKFVTNTRRQKQAIRTETVAAAKNFLAERLNIEQEKTLDSMRQLLTSETSQEFVDRGKHLVLQLFPNKVAQFADEVCETWSVLEETLQASTLPLGSDPGACLSNKLRKLITALREAKTVQKLLAAIVTLSPHSMQTERIVSHYNTIHSDHRPMKEATVNSRLLVSLNGGSIASYDPRPAVANFLKKKDRRMREPTEAYKTREFAVKFFHGGSF